MSFNFLGVSLFVLFNFQRHNTVFQNIKVYIYIYIIKFMYIYIFYYIYIYIYMFFYNIQYSIFNITF
jgi:hypothetical protein